MQALIASKNFGRRSTNAPDLYAYTNGNPISRRDPSGLLVQFDMGSPGIGALIAAYAQIGQTNTGASLERMLENSPFLYTITTYADPDYCFPADANPYTGGIHVNPGFHPPIAVQSCGGAAYETPSTATVLEHELGHAATGITNEMENIIQNVNPYRSELGLPAQIAYGSPTVFNWYDPIGLPYSGAQIILPNR